MVMANIMRVNLIHVTYYVYPFFYIALFLIASSFESLLEKKMPRISGTDNERRMYSLIYKLTSVSIARVRKSATTTIRFDQRVKE